MKTKPRKKPIIGQVIYSLPQDRYTRRDTPELTTRIICKVGRKYFYLEGDWQKTKYCIETWCEVSDYCATHVLYESKQEYVDEIEHTKLSRELHDTFSTYRVDLTLESLREIVVIINKEKESPCT